MRNRTEIKVVHQFKYAFRGVETTCIEYNKEVSFIENQIKGLSTISDVKVTDVTFPSKMRDQTDKGIARILNIEFIIMLIIIWTSVCCALSINIVGMLISLIKCTRMPKF